MQERRHGILTKWIIWYSIGIHLLWGSMLLVDPAAKGVTAIHGLFRLVGTAPRAAAVYLVVGCLAGWGLWRAREGRARGLIAIVPQQAVLLISAFSAGEAVWNSQYADGVVRSRAFIGADQLPVVFLAAAHTIAMVHIFAPWGRGAEGRK